jgi:RND family efflux transporter MFP subunit
MCWRQKPVPQEWRRGKPPAWWKRRSIRFAVTAAGDIGPAEQVSVRPEVNGKIADLPVDIGDRIKKDQVLFTLDDFDLQTERSSRLTDIERTKLELEKAGRDYERSKRLIAEKLISQELFDDTRTEFELKKNSLERAQKDLSLVEYRLTKTKILAPFDCTVLTRPVSVGQAVSGSGGFNSGTEVLTIANLNDMVINAHINQADITRLSQGQEVDVQVESMPGLKLKGLVERIAPQTTIKNNIKGYAVRIAMKGLDARVLPGMTANVSIPVASSENALALPMAAVFSEQGERFVFVKKDDRFERRPVQIGVADYDYAEVLNGVTEGEIVSLETPPGETAIKLAQKPAGDGTNRVLSTGFCQRRRRRSRCAPCRWRASDRRHSVVEVCLS